METVNTIAATIAATTTTTTPAKRTGNVLQPVDTNRNNASAITNNTTTTTTNTVTPDQQGEPTKQKKQRLLSLKETVEWSIQYETAFHKGTLANDNDNDKVCSFVVRKIQGRSGHCDSDYQVNLLVGQHGLFDLVLKVFQLMNQEKVTDDRYDSHLWSITFDGTTYHYGWRGCPADDEYCPSKHCDAQDIRALKDFALKTGQTGRFQGESATFDFSVQAVHEKPEKDTRYPVSAVLLQSYSADLSEDWLSTDKQRKSLEVRQAWQDYYKGSTNASKRDGRTGVVIPCKPNPPTWNREELELLGLLLNAGHKFAKSWKTILQYALVNRPQSAASGQWYKLQKEGYRLQYIGQGKSKSQMVLLAKKLAKSKVENALSRMPPTQAEILKERRRLHERDRKLRAGMWPECDDNDDPFLAQW